MYASRSTLTVVLSYLLILFLPSIQASSLFDSEFSLTKRQGVLGSVSRVGGVNGNICARVALQAKVVVTATPLVTANVPIGQTICVCATASGLTDASLASIAATVTANQGTVTDLVNAVGSIANGLTGLIDSVTGLTLPLLRQQSTSCTYSPNSTPNSCDSCSATCNTGFEQLCGTTCIAPDAPCNSGVPGRRRDLQGRSSRFVCPTKKQACLIPGLSTKAPKELSRRNYECIDTTTDLESCGGCVIPLPGRPAGQDCTAIQNALDVACRAGTCIVESCEKGYEVDASTGGCVLSEVVEHAKAPASSFGTYWAAVQGASDVLVHA